MKIIDVPVYNEDGSIKFTQQVSPAEAQWLLQFALNFVAAHGHHALMMDDEMNPDELND